MLYWRGLGGAGRRPGKDAMRFAPLFIALVLALQPPDAGGAGEARDPMAHALCQSASECRTLGLNLQQAGDDEAAFDYLRIACEDHSPVGALFTCANYFTAAKNLGRLGEAHSRLEMRCAGGDEFLCYHLARAYLAVDLPQEAERLLKPLCESGYKLPFKAAFGPCRDLAGSLKESGETERALQAYRADCKLGGTSGELSCESAKNLERKKAGHGERKEPRQLALLGILALPFLSLLMLILGGRSSLLLTKWGLPVLALVLWGAWESRVFGIYDIRLDLVLILPAVFAVYLFAVLAERKLRRGKPR